MGLHTSMSRQVHTSTYKQTSLLRISLPMHTAMQRGDVCSLRGLRHLRLHIHPEGGLLENQKDAFGVRRAAQGEVSLGLLRSAPMPPQRDPENRSESLRSDGPAASVSPIPLWGRTCIHTLRLVSESDNEVILGLAVCVHRTA